MTYQPLIIYSSGWSIIVQQNDDVHMRLIDVNIQYNYVNMQEIKPDSGKMKKKSNFQ